MSRKVIKLNALPLMQTQKRVAAYARVSSGKDEMLHSLAAQVEYYRNLIRVHPEWEYAGVYADEAYTGTKGDRPEFTLMLSACRAGKLDMIITKSISRFARNTVTLLETVRELKTLGVDVFFEEQNLHTTSADGELMLTILASYAQEESLSASENCKWRIRNEFRNGNPSSGLMIYGYESRDRKLVINPQEAEVVRMIYADYLSGMGRNAIMRKLDQLGIPTKHGGRWAVNTIVGILTNEKLTGDICLQKYYVVDHLTKRKIRNNGQLPQYYVEGSHEGIIDHETFEAVRAEMSRRSQKYNHPVTKPARSEFTGLITCGRCGAHFRRKINACGTKYAKPTWTCMTYSYRGKEQCPAKRIPEDILKQKCAEVMGISVYDSERFRETVSSITVPDDNILVFTFYDGSERTITWQNRSRRESWTPAMREAARAATLRRQKNG